MSIHQRPSDAGSTVRLSEPTGPARRAAVAGGSAADDPVGGRLSNEDCCRGEIELRGCVQGGGVRPAIARLAVAGGVCGRVLNTMSGVAVEVEGDLAALERFFARLPSVLAGSPEMRWSSVPAPSQRVHHRFRIDASTVDQFVSTAVPLDRVSCQQCLQETFARGNRRFEYPFTSCASCGPRYSLLRDMPYDRQRTSMADFEMCELCLREYESPEDRRFHAQTNACPRCGPRLWLATPKSDEILFAGDAWRSAADSIAAGEIVALKGIGGYQLICDATNEKSVDELRRRKRRTAKPLAVMVANVEEANALSQLSSLEHESLRSAAGPIVVSQSRANDPLADQIHPGLNDIGLMLPTTPLHALLAARLGRPLVVTSGNVEGEPLAYQTQSAEQTLSGVADHFLHHDRPIVHPVDDSVCRLLGGRMVPLRLGRGLAPMSITLPNSNPASKDGFAENDEAIAVGGQQKSAVALNPGGQMVLGPHIGDLDTPGTRQRFTEQASRLRSLYQAGGRVIAHDAHPDYYSTCWAREQAECRASAPTQSLVSVQHHHAHVVAAMAEHGLLDRRVLGIAFDGTGLGPDGTIWGGECLLATRSDFTRVGHLRPFSLLGGEIAVRQPWRAAAALLLQSGVGDCEISRTLRRIKPANYSVDALRRLMKSSSSTVTTSSAGRLFDAIACLVLNRPTANYQAELAMGLEAICERSVRGRYSMPLSDTSVVQIDWRPTIRSLVADLQRDEPAASMAMRFHRGLAQAICDMAMRFPDIPVLITGGVFQNRVMVDLVSDQMKRHRSRLRLPTRVPPGDGGLALGQLAVSLSASRD